MPVTLQHAVLAAEDREFYEHGGFSPTGIVRAAWNDLRGGSLAGRLDDHPAAGQELLPDPGPHAVAARSTSSSSRSRSSSTLSKDQILEDYLNTIYFGRGAYGVQAAAQAYFGTDVQQPDAGAGRGPRRRSCARPAATRPSTTWTGCRTAGPTSSTARCTEGWLTPQAAGGCQVPDHRPAGSPEPSGPNGYLVAYVQSELAARGISEDDLASGGLKVYTTFDKTAQAAAVTAVNAQRPTSGSKGVRVGLASVDPATGGDRGDVRRPRLRATRSTSTTRRSRSPRPGRRSRRSRSPPRWRTASRWTRRGTAERARLHRRATAARPSRSRTRTTRATAASRLLQATEDSVNTVFVDVENQPQVGADKVVDAARRAGIPDDVQIAADPVRDARRGVADGARHGRGVRARSRRGGLRNKPTTVTKVSRAERRDPATSSTARPTRAFAQDVVAQVDFALQKVVTNGTGVARPAPSAGRWPARPGTTDSNLSAWFVGYTPQMSTAVVLFRTGPDGRTRASLDGCGRGRTGQRRVVPGRDLDRVHVGGAEGEAGAEVPGHDAAARDHDQPHAQSLGLGADRLPVTVAVRLHEPVRLTQPVRVAVAAPAATPSPSAPPVGGGARRRAYLAS